MNGRHLWMVVAVVALMGFVSCDDGDGKNGDGSDSDADTDTDTDTDADTDTDSDTDPYNCGAGIYDVSSGLCWQHPRHTEDLMIGFALEYCDGLNLGGYKDWYLPSIIELADLLSECDEAIFEESDGSCNPCVESQPCNDLFGNDTGTYWSSTYVGANYHRQISFETGQVIPASPDTPNNVRCVRVPL